MGGLAPVGGGGEFVHALGVYETPTDRTALVAAFLEEGLVAGEHAYVAAYETETLRAALPDSPNITFAGNVGDYLRPAAAVAVLTARFERHAATAGTRFRVVGEIDPRQVSSALDWEPWARYEAAVNELYARFSVTALCLYGGSTTPTVVARDLQKTHRWIAGCSARWQPSPDYLAPATFLQGRPAATNPLQTTLPEVHLVDATPYTARLAVRAAANRSKMADRKIDDLVCAVSETVANAQLHGEPPVVVRAWSGPDRMLVEVSDTGSGPRDPFVGLAPVGHGHRSGRGLWIAHQLCDRVTHVADGGRFSVRLTLLA